MHLKVLNSKKGRTNDINLLYPSHVAFSASNSIIVATTKWQSSTNWTVATLKVPRNLCALSQSYSIVNKLRAFLANDMQQ